MYTYFTRRYCCWTICIICTKITKNKTSEKRTYTMEVENYLDKIFFAKGLIDGKTWKRRAAAHTNAVVLVWSERPLRRSPWAEKINPARWGGEGRWGQRCCVITVRDAVSCSAVKQLLTPLFSLSSKAEMNLHQINLLSFTEPRSGKLQPGKRLSDSKNRDIWMNRSIFFCRSPHSVWAGTSLIIE